MDPERVLMGSQLGMLRIRLSPRRMTAAAIAVLRWASAAADASPADLQAEFTAIAEWVSSTHQRYGDHVQFKVVDVASHALLGSCESGL